MKKTGLLTFLIMVVLMQTVQGQDDQKSAAEITGTGNHPIIANLSHSGSGLNGDIACSAETLNLVPTERFPINDV